MTQWQNRYNLIERWIMRVCGKTCRTYERLNTQKICILPPFENLKRAGKKHGGWAVLGLHTKGIFVNYFHLPLPPAMLVTCLSFHVHGKLAGELQWNEHDLTSPTVVLSGKIVSSQNNLSHSDSHCKKKKLLD
jgi:hypothetical protein